MMFPPKHTQSWISAGGKYPDWKLRQIWKISGKSKNKSWQDATCLSELSIINHKFTESQSVIIVKCTFKRKLFRCLSSIRETLAKNSNGTDISQFQVETLVKQKDFCFNLFLLFDHHTKGYLVQEEWISALRNCSVNLGYSCWLFSSALLWWFIINLLRSESLKNELVDILDYWSYLLCKDDDISQDMFYEVSQQ